MRIALQAYTLSECMELMGEYVRSYEELGGENLLFCEDRLTLVAERALTRAVGGTFRSSVSTFARFLQVEGATVSKQGSVMLVGEVMSRLLREGKLQCFTSPKGVGKNARYIYETLAQFAASQITPALLREGLSELSEDTLKRKISDLALIYEGYLSSLTEGGYLDESRYLTLLPQRIRKEGQLRGKNVFFLCYSSFTAQTKETIRAAIETAENVVGIFCGGEEEMYTNAAFNAFVGVCNEYGKTLVKKEGTPLDGDAEPLRKGLFNPKRRMPIATENIRLFEGEDKTSEAEYAAVKIKRLLAENPSLRYRDFALLVPNVAEYSLPVKKAFAEYGIPFFIDEKKSIKQHPLSKFLLDCFRVAKEGTSAAVQALTSNYFFGDSDEYRNYLLKFANYRGGARRPLKMGEAVEGLFPLEALESGRTRFLLATEPIKPKGYGREYCRAVWKILEDFEVEEKLNALQTQLQDVAQQGYLSQIYPALEKVLTEAERLVGGKEMTAAEFSVILEDGFDAMEISLIPLKADAVFVGDISQSRIEKVWALFALGMTDAVPLSTGDTAIVSDREIAKLSEVKAMLEPTVAEVNRRARESVCLNLCAFTRKLYLSYPLAADGSEPSVSEIFRYIDGVFCEDTGDKLLRRKRFSPADFPYECSSLTPAVRQMLLEKADFENRADNSTAECSAVYTALKRMGVVDLDDFWREQEPVYVRRGEELFFHDGKISPTSLEGYFACPFGNFVDRGLRLKEREEATVMAVDSGNFIHALLEKVALKANEIATEEELKAYATQVGRELANTSVYLLQQDDKAGAYSSEKLLSEGVTVAVEAFKQIKNSSFKVEQTEAALQSEQFIGKVDRVDGSPEYIRIIDYKTGKIDDSPTSYYTGQKLQMQLYMSELQGERIPAGVFYFPASVAYTYGEEGKFRMKGYMNGAQEALLAGDNNLEEGKKSEYFDASLGENKRLSKVMDGETFQYFIDYGALVANKGIEEIKKGYIAPSPYEGRCKYCKYGGMCGFNRERFAERKESAVEPKRIAEIAKKEKGE